jgi:hypothetical protein
LNRDAPARAAQAPVSLESVIFCRVVLRIDEIVQNAHAFDPRASMTTDLRPAVEALFDELEAKGVDYVLVGGVALLSYVEGRNTQDIDLIVSPDDLGKLPWNAEVQDMDFARATYRGVRVDLLLRTNALFDEVAKTARTTVPFQGRPVVTATREGLLLLKLYALPSLYRTANLARAALYETDVLMLHQGAQGATVDDAALLERLRPHLSAHDIAELRGILEEQRARRRFT